MSASADAPRRRRNGTIVTVAHLDDAIALALQPIKSDIRGVRRDVVLMRRAIRDAVDRLDRRPVRRFFRWLVHEAHSAYRTGATAVISAGVVYALTRFL